MEISLNGVHGPNAQKPVVMDCKLDHDLVIIQLLNMVDCHAPEIQTKIDTARWENVVSIAGEIN